MRTRQPPPVPLTSASVPMASTMPVNIRLHPPIGSKLLHRNGNQLRHRHVDAVEESHTALADGRWSHHHVHAIDNTGLPGRGVHFRPTLEEQGRDVEWY